ncbi:MAG: HD domain-containing protein [Pseudomonadota bacterium]
MEQTAEDIYNAIAQAFARGESAYGEALSIRDHMLQSAFLAEQDGASDRLVVATLLHDYGYLMDHSVSMLENFEHEHLGADLISRWFDIDIVNAVRFHVDAKRYLCATESDYINHLSDASQATLRAQGGPMAPDEVDEFKKNRGYDMALEVRRYDDLGKDPASFIPDLEHYRPKILACLKTDLR